jgi:hypothetical protein
MSAVAIPAETPPHGLGSALGGVAHELALLEAHLLRVQNICHVPEHAAHLDAVLVRELQTLDLVSQRLGVLTHFIRHVVAAVAFDPAVDLTDALGAIPLQDMADRLTAHAADEEAPADVFESGDFDLF